MATNPMQKKSRISFILGMLVMLIIASLVVAFLYLKIKKQNEEINQYKPKLDVVVNGKTTEKGNARSIYVFSQDVESGQVLTSNMFKKETVLNSLIPENATSDIMATIDSFSISTEDGKSIYYNAGTPGSSENPERYYIKNGNNEQVIYVTDNSGKDMIATDLKAGDKAFVFDGNNKVDIKVATNTVVAKVNIKKNTIATSSLITRENEITSDDLRKEEFNVISLPVDLAPGEYVDIRLMLPNGQNYVVVSKKKISIPAVNGQYLADTIQMNLTEEEIMIMSSAIVENFKTTGSKLYATRYTEAGMQEAATMTYYPNSDVQNAIQNDPNIVIKAIQGILEKREQIRKSIDSEIRKDESTDEEMSTKTETSITSTQEQRKNYLQTLPVVQ